MLSIIILPVNIAWAGWQQDEVCQGSCGGACGPCPDSASAVPAGPTPEEIQQQKEQAEQADLIEDAQYSFDEGKKAYGQGDWNGAVKYFKQALDNAPDDPNIKSKYNDALQRMNDGARSTEAARQLQAIAQVAQDHPDMDNKIAQQGFDTSTAAAGPMTGTVAVATPQASSANDPIVPDSKRTPEITAIEEKRTAFRDRIKKLDEALKNLDPSKVPVKIAKLKQEKSNLDNNVHYLNFSIGDILTKPAQK